MQYFLVLLGFGLIATTESQMVEQCTCAVFNPCFASAESVARTCADRCQNHITALGGSYPAVRQCITAQEGRLRQGLACVRGSLGNVCASGPGHMVPFRSIQSAQNVAVREFNSILRKSGLFVQAASLLQAGRRGFDCLLGCAQQNACAKKLGCGFALPSDNIVIANIRRCAAQVGFNTQSVRGICHCVANAGIRQLVPMCDKIII